MIKKLLKSAFNKAGYELQRKNIGEIGFNPSYLSTICNPDLVIDVGVAYGTIPLYEAFPNSDLILVEPLKEYKKYIDLLVERYNAKIHYTALGKEKGSLQISFDHQDLEKASFFERTKLTENRGAIEDRTVTVETLDELLSEENLAGKKTLLKIDTEGAELEVLMGATRSLPYIDFIIVETSLAKRFEGSYEFEDMIAFMKEHGFGVYSFLTMPFPPNESRQRFTDILFYRK